MSIKLRQLCLVAEELAPILEDLESVFGLEVCFVDEGVAVFGLENALMPIGSNFIEVVAPAKEGTAAGRYLQRRGGNGGYMVITQASSQEVQAQARERAEALNIRIAWEHEHKHGKFMQLHPADVGGSFFEIDHVAPSDTPDYWPPAGGTGWENKVNEHIVSEILGAEIQSEDPEALAERWGQIADRPVACVGEDTFKLEFDNAYIRFARTTDASCAGLSAIDLDCSNESKAMEAAAARNLFCNDNQIVLCGTRFNLT